MSTYFSHPDVPPYRPTTYPKRRRRARPRPSFGPSPIPDDFTYADFLRLRPEAARETRTA